MGAHTEIVEVKSFSGTRYIEFECVRYFFNTAKGSFISASPPIGETFGEIFNNPGLTSADAGEVLAKRGPNAIAFPADTFISGLVKEFTGYFYIYQLMTLWVWYYYAFYYMGLALTIVIVASGYLKARIALKSQRLVLEMASFTGKANVIRDGKWQSIDTSLLVPGDVMEIPENSQVLPVDCVLIRGGGMLNCLKFFVAVADESSLTGEALPVAKFSIDNSARKFDRATSKVYMLYAGSKIFQTSQPQGGGRVCAVVTDTGADSIKGKLVKDILYPTPIIFVFLEHLKLVFALLGIWGIAIMFLMMWIIGSDSIDSWFYGAIGVTKVLSPLLPAVLVIGQSVAAERLRKKNILCVDLQRITLGGKVKVFAFDKTGTFCLLAYS